ncbi:ABC transporter substrate-binding protein [Desulfosporosinus sp. PR]|uniref:ABC transporter substrate-binding protein n=1 Tax=Candidatus Desulfosporosinus nitrosoreducens TaxID=3401928 RepID=UPI0027EFE05E|nr:ABC transporter substrate-binding protein [Desulfosporosinus sp. PR]MDQ7095674.1 ABC transporter substrate-binding protein [Desulfosporosinus sp. PR]
MACRKRLLSSQKIIGPIVIVMVVAALLAGCAQSAQSSAKPQAEPTKVTDLAGRTVTLPADITRVAALVGPGYEKMLMLGQVDKLVLTMPISSKWAPVIAPALKSVPTTASFQDPNIEDLLNKKIQAVFFWDYKQPLDKMTAAGIPVIATQVTSGNPTSAKEFVEFQKREVQLFGNVLGPEAKKKADQWCAFLDEKVNYVTSRTGKLKAGERPSVYYVRGPEALTVHGRNSYTEWYIEMAGGDLVTKNTPKEIMDTVTMEQVLAWNPEVIFMGRVNNTDLIMKDPKWSKIKAVQDKKVFVNPNGVMSWDYSSEGPLLMEFIAKTLHPELFEDLNMVQELKDYYAKFYNYTLTDDQANRILKFLPPAN